MTRKTTMDKDQLAAFADGELSPEEAAAIVMHLVDHPEDQAYIDDVMAANVALSKAFAAPIKEDVPERLKALLLPESRATGGAAPKVIPFPKKNRTRLALAGLVTAGLALAAVIAAVAFLPGSGAGLSVGPVADNSTLHQVLSRTPSGETVGFGTDGFLTILSSLPVDTGYCREFELVLAKKSQLQLGLACHEGKMWVVDVVLAEALEADVGPDDGYVPASGDEAGAMDKWLDRRGAGVVLTPEQEAGRIEAGWAQ
ncbi:MAG: anti-sigma factor family protein [Paracoccaceae bacterium]